MNVLVTGASGYVGSALLRRLLAEGHEVRALVRSGGALNRAIPGGHPALTEVLGDLLEPDSYRDALVGCEAVIHLVGIIREQPSRGVTFQRIHIQGTRALAEACRRTPGLRRFVHMSALGAREGAVSAYHRSKYEAERIVHDSGIPYIAFRPSVIFGPGDEFVNMLAGLVRLPLTPVIGSGQYRMQPVSIRTVTELFAKALHLPDSETGLRFEVGGPDVLAFNDMLREIGRAMNRRVHLVHQPLWLMRPAIRLLDRFPFFPITRHQLTMLLEENIVRDGGGFADYFKPESVAFREGIREYIGPGLN